MEAAILKIYGDIGEADPMSEMFGITDSSVSAKTVSEFLDSHKEASDITVKINSSGGDVQEGWAINDLLTNSGKKIKTIGEGKVYSIATIIFLAGSEREIMKNADGLIHNPFIPPYTLADQYEAEDLLKLAESLKQEEAKILDYYVERTGSSADKLAEYMKEDTKLSAEDMLSLGFATKILEPVKAYAIYKPKNSFKMDEKEFKTLGQKLDTIIDKIKNLSRITPSDQTLKDKDGKEFNLDKESGGPVVGDTASPDGSYVMADGKTIVISGGKITEIKEATVAKTELELANERIAELQATLNAKTKEVVDTTKVKEEVEAEKVKAFALVTELQSLKNTWKPSTRTVLGVTPKVGEIDLNRVKDILDNHKNDK
ncbi:MAG: Clp protease ClpP [candidate division Zixibacteria bacterium]|nr:Clp protease ClpP [candidate division Zixibacteria bacterium]